jgi:hypothetical protein
MQTYMGDPKVAQTIQGISMQKRFEAPIAEGMP